MRNADLSLPTYLAYYCSSELHYSRPKEQALDHHSNQKYLIDWINGRILPVNLPHLCPTMVCRHMQAAAHKIKLDFVDNHVHIAKHCGETRIDVVMVQREVVVAMSKLSEGP